MSYEIVIPDRVIKQIEFFSDKYTWFTEKLIETLEALMIDNKKISIRFSRGPGVSGVLIGPVIMFYDILDGKICLLEFKQYTYTCCD